MPEINENLIAETAFLASIFSKPDNLNLLTDVEPEWFSYPNNAKIFGTIKSLYLSGQAIDPVTVKAHCGNNDVVAQVDKILAFDEFNSENFQSYQNFVENYYIQRTGVAELQNSIYSLKMAKQEEVRDTLDAVEASVFHLTQRGSRVETMRRMGDIGIDVMKNLRRIKEFGHSPYICNTGLIDIDRNLGGFSAGDYIVIAGRPSMGKSAFALSLSRYWVKQNIPVGWISIEMPSEQMFLRLLSSESNINSMRIKNGEFTTLEFDQMAVCWRKINQMPFFIDDKSQWNETTLRGAARRLAAQHGVKILLIDYLQLMDSARSAENRQQEITKISRSIKALARDLKIPVIAISQLSREVERRTPPRPNLSDLRESGSIEQDADIVMFVYRPEYYGIQSFEDQTPTTGIAEIIIGKARNASVGSTKVIFIKETGRFESLAKPNEIV